MDKTLIESIKKLSSKEIEEVIEFCKTTLEKKPQLKKMIKDKFKDPKYTKCKFFMVGGIYDVLYEKGTYDYSLEDINEYENVLKVMYQRSDLKYKRVYNTFEDFEKDDLIITIYQTEGTAAVKDFMCSLKDARDYPVDKSELSDSDGGFAVIWVYNNNTKEIYKDNFDIQ